MTVTTGPEKLRCNLFNLYYIHNIFILIDGTNCTQNCLTVLGLRDEVPQEAHFVKKEIGECSD